MNYIFSISFLFIFLLVAFTTKEYSVEESNFVVHTVDASKGNLKLYWKDTEGNNYGSLKNLKESLAQQNETLVFAMNGGMYQKDRSPQGLFIQNGKTIQKANTVQRGYGNFYLQPNGVFSISKLGEASVQTTKNFNADGTINYATQSGPMLLVDGKYHPKLIKGSSNLHIRNGVGILPDGKVLFAMSKKEVNFYDLATLFKQNGCQNALYLDGFVSRTFLPSKNWEQLDGNFGVIIGETK